MAFHASFEWDTPPEAKVGHDHRAVYRVRQLDDGRGCAYRFVAEESGSGARSDFAAGRCGSKALYRAGRMEETAITAQFNRGPCLKVRARTVRTDRPCLPHVIDLALPRPASDSADRDAGMIAPRIRLYGSFSH